MAQRETETERPWTPPEITSLYRVYTQMDLTLPRLWERVAQSLQTLGIQRSGSECQRQWFLSVTQRERQREKLLQRKTQTQIAQTLEKLKRFSTQTQRILGVKVTETERETEREKTGKERESETKRKRETERETETETAGIIETDDRNEDGEDEKEEKESEEQIKNKRQRLGKNDLKVFN